MHRLVIALVTLIGLTGVAVVAAYLFLFAAGTDRAARLAPADSAAYVNVYLQPSTGQQMNLSNLIGRLPGFADEASLDEKVDQIVQNLLSGSGIDYREEIKPWLGDQVAVATWPGEGETASAEAVVIAAVKDREAAEAAIGELAGDAAETETYDGVDLHVADETAYAFVDEMLVAGGSADALRAVVDVRGDAPSLAEQEAFRQAMNRIPADHLASVYANPSAAAEVAGAEGQLSEVGPTSAALVAEAEGLRLSGTAPLPERAAASPDETEADVASTLPEMMPATAIAELVVFDLASLLREAEAAAGAAPGGEEVTSTLDTLRAVAAFGLGIDIDADILPLLAGEVGVVITDVDGELPSGQVLLRPHDAEAGLGALDRLASGVGALGGASRTDEVDGVEITTLELPDLGEVSYAGIEDVIVIGLGADAVTTALEAQGGASLADSEAYRRAFALAGTRAGTELWVDVSAAVEALGLDATLPSDARDILSRIGSFGLTAPARDDHIEFHAVLTVDEP